MIRILFMVSVLALALVGCDNSANVEAEKQAQAEQNKPKVDPNLPKLEGKVTIDKIPNLKAEDNFALRGRLYDVTDPTKAPVMVTEFRHPVSGGMPLAFQLPYQPSKMQAGKRYAVDVGLMVGDTQLKGSNELIPVAAGSKSLGDITLITGGKVDVNTTPEDKVRNLVKALEMQLGNQERFDRRTIKRTVDRTTYGGDAFYEKEGNLLRLVRQKINNAGKSKTEQYFVYRKDGTPLYAKQNGKELGWDSKGNIVLNVNADDGVALTKSVKSVFASLKK